MGCPITTCCISSAARNKYPDFATILTFTNIITERVQECGPGTLQSKLQFINVKEREKDASIPDGLGPLPHNVNTVGSLTIYNTAESPYSAGLKSDPLEAKMRARKQLEDDLEGEDENCLVGIKNKWDDRNCSSNMWVICESISVP